ncbi:MAG: twin-arginine translocation signal domain-containing protein [Planctomycetes bacterium]|nr:twin-arginine translocation signal domain-containing protein [Planctomycetota bacterium]
MTTQFNRRDLLKAAAAAGLAAGPLAAADPLVPPQIGDSSVPPLTKGGPGGVDARAASAAADLIHRENARPGTPDWQLTRVRVNRGNYRTSLVEGYCSKQSVAAGKTLSIHVSTEPARLFTLEVFRMGFYGGAGARLMRSFGPLPGRTQSVPDIGEKRLRE